MIGFLFRIVLALSAISFNTYLFMDGSWGWGITFIFPTLLIILSFFRNEKMIWAMYQMQRGNNEKAKKYINKITHPQFMLRKQHAYILYLKALMNAQDYSFGQCEQLLRKALSLGLRTNEDNAVARMHLAGICAQSGRRKEAMNLISEAKKFDKKGMLKDQIKMMQQQMQMAPSKNQMRMAQMMGGRKPRMR
jgi:tetratricopeptide (TPR) repeat protein